MKKIIFLFLFVAVTAKAFIPPPPQTAYYTTYITNFWSIPGDYISINADGRNMATVDDPVVFDLYFDTNDLFTTGEIAGNGTTWSLTSRLDWDGTNINWFVQFNTGDPSNSFITFFGTLTNAIVGTNQVTFVINGNTNGLTMDSSSIIASRAPPIVGGVSFIPKGQNVQGNGIIKYDPDSTNATSATAQVTVDTNGIIIAPTNFFEANSNANWVIISPFVVGYIASQNFATNNGTNFVTIQLFTNSVLQNHQSIIYSTNNAFWGLSNFLAVVPNLFGWDLGEGDDAGNPPENIIGGLIGSYTGTNGWFALTNGFITTNLIYISQTNTGVSLRGSPRVNSGFARLYSVDHPELTGRTNFLDYEFIGSHVAPTADWQFVNKAYVDAAVANTLSPFLMTTDTNGVTHTSYSHNGKTIFDMSSVGGWFHIDGLTPDSTHTNLLLTVAQTNLTTLWEIQSSTNLALINGWTQFTNWTSVTTNVGEVTFTIPMREIQFFRGTVPSTDSLTLNGAPLIVNGAPLTGIGVIQFYAQTNTPMISDLGNQPGARFWVSNGVCWVTGSTNGTTTWTRQIAP